MTTETRSRLKGRSVSQEPPETDKSKEWISSGESEGNNTLSKP